MDWELCKTFVAVAETRSFAAAARRLRSSHPTVGRKIAELEGQLGIPLFARSNEGLSLTAQGRKFREHVEAMAAAALRAEAAVSATGAQARGVVKLSINGKFVNGISKATQRKGYLCLESEGAEIHFRNIKILELPPGMVTPEQTGVEAEK